MALYSLARKLPLGVAQFLHEYTGGIRAHEGRDEFLEH